ncbi:MAG: hypothetical protein O2800_05585 [Planctomycetota bacterium]|nr:hypothetical protein [Planctomycetota bacterium]
MRTLSNLFVVFVLTLATIGLTASNAFAQVVEEIAINGDSLGGFVLPVLPVESDITLDANETFAWTSGDTKRLLLKGDVRVSCGSYFFTADTAVVWINRVPSAGGLINQLAVWFPVAREPTRRAGLGASGTDLLVTASARGKVRLDCPLVFNRSPGRDASVEAATRRLVRYLRALAGGDSTLRTQPLIQVDPVLPPAPLVVGEGVVQSADQSAQGTPTATPTTIARQGAAKTPIISPGSIISFSGNEVTTEESSDSILIDGAVMLDVDPIRSSTDSRAMQLVADRVVIFLKAGSLKGLRESTTQVDASSVEGIYLEGNVSVTDFSYTIRGQRIYYDVIADRAIMVDSVLRSTFRDGSPAVARAKELRQLASNQWEANDLTLSSSEFAEPHLSIGASHALVTQTDEPTGSTILAEAEHVTIRAGGTPFFYWPKLRGSPQSYPLRRLAIGEQKYTGTEVSAELDPFILMGLDVPDGWSASLPMDYYSKNGAGAGLRLGRNIGSSRASFSMYGWNDLLNSEQTYAGLVMTAPQEFRGELLGDYSADLGGGWRSQLQMAYLSDAAWAATFRQGEYGTRREYETSAFLEQTGSNASLQMQVKGTVNDFVSTGWQMASRPYTVQKLPELIYRRAGDDLWSQVTWTHEYQLAGIDLELQNASAAQSGLNPQAISTDTNLSASDNIASAYQSAGYDQELRWRVTTRQEMSLPFDLSGVRMAPFVFGLGAGYFGDNFSNYGGNDGNTRALLGGGLRLSSRLTTSYDGIESSLLDIHRLRHVIEPYSTLYSAYDSGATYDRPVYDQEIEAISGSWVTQFGVTQRLQTMRGAPGDWRSVDMVVLDTGIVFDGMDASGPRNDTNAGVDALQWRMSPTPAFYSWRPELSQRGSHAYGTLTYEASDAVTVYGSTTYLFDDELFANSDGFPRRSFGASVKQAPDLSVYGEYRYIYAFNPATASTYTYTNDEFLQGGFIYDISKTYDLNSSLQWDLLAKQFRGWNVGLMREFPDMDFGVRGGYDAIQDEYNISFVLRIGLPGKPRSTIGINPNQDT